MSLFQRLRYELYGRQLPPIGLALFRIAYSFVLLCEVGQLFHLRHLIFDPVPYLQQPDISYTPALLAWMLVLVCLLLGWQTRTAAWVNYAYTLLTFATFHQFEYHVDYVYSGANLLLPFLPVSECLSIDAFLRRGARKDSRSSRVSVFNYHAPVIVGIALLYVDSMGYKLASPMWLSGLGLWRPASYPHNSWLFDPSWLLDQKYFVLAMGYVVLLFEGSFPFLFFWSVLRGPIFALGISFHLAIAIIFPIPWFGLTAVALYLLVLPYDWYERLDVYLCRGRPREVAASGAPVELRIAVVLTAGAIILQAPFIARTPIVKKVAGALGVERARAALDARTRVLDSFSRIVFGCTAHPVFMDYHFNGYDHIVTFDRIGDDPDRPGPVIPETGMASYQNTGRHWVHWNWRVCGAKVDMVRLRDGLARFTAFHANRSVADARYRILARAYDVATQWESGFYKRQLSRPWVEIGEVRWKDGEFQAEISEVEAVK